MVRVFFIMPLRADRGAEGKRRIIQDVIGDNVVMPPDIRDEMEGTFDLRETVNNLSRADLVIADLSFERPSCYFELGLSQAKGISTYILAESGTTIHQHAGDVHFYRDLEEYRRLIVAAVAERA